MRRYDNPPFRAMDEYVGDMPRLPVSAGRIGHAIAFPGLNHRHFPEDANSSLIHNVFE